MTNTINTKLSLNGCWKMVNRIEAASSADKIRERCYTAEQWLAANEVITIEQFDELMNAVAFIHRESYKH